MYTNRVFRQSGNADVLEPSQDADKYGYREISGDVPSTGARAHLLCWAVVFEQETAASDRYRQIVSVLGMVDGDGLATARLEHFEADRFGNMSERTDTLGEFATVWVTGSTHGGNSRGAVLVAVGDTLLHVLALSQYEAVFEHRAVRVIERLAAEMASRQSELTLAPWADTMSRLPILDDLGDSLENTSIGVNRYSVGT